VEKVKADFSSQQKEKDNEHQVKMESRKNVEKN